MLLAIVTLIIIIKKMLFVYSTAEKAYIKNAINMPIIIPFIY